VLIVELLRRWHSPDIPPGGGMATHSELETAREETKDDTDDGTQILKIFFQRAPPFYFTSSSTSSVSFASLYTFNQLNVRTLVHRWDRFPDSMKKAFVRHLI